MAPFDYTSSAACFAFGNSAGSAVDPVSETAVMGALVSGMSRAIDSYCNQAFSLATYTLESYRALIDQDGSLTCYPPVPTMAAPTAADWRLGSASNWAALAIANLDVEVNSFGCVVRAINGAFGFYRGARLQMRLSYTGGWANLAAVPVDFEWAMRALCWWAYQKRSAPGETTAIPELGVLIVPGNWPNYIREMFRPYVRQVPM
jgi:hypothetical protein